MMCIPYDDGGKLFNTIVFCLMGAPTHSSCLSWFGSNIN